MSKGLKLILNLLLLFCLVACSRSTNVSPLLKKAEGYMNERPDSALYLLDSIIRPEALSNEDKVLWSLLITQARDKKYITHTSDSLINIAVHYYDKKGNIERRAQAYYCQGRVYMDMLLFDEAIISFSKAEEFVLLIKDYALQARIYNQLGDLYRNNALYDKSLVYYQKANESYRMENHQLGIASTLRDIGLAYQNLGKLDSSLICLNHSLEIIKENNWKKLMRRVLICLSNVYESKSLYQEAIRCINQSLEIGQDEEQLYSAYYSLGCVYDQLGQIDSACYYWEKALNSPDINIQNRIYRHFSLLAYQKKEYGTAFKYNEQYLLLRDSIERIFQPQKLAEIDARYNYLRLINEKNQLELKKEEAKKIYLLIIIALLVFVFICAILLYRKQQKIKDNERSLLDYRNQLKESKTELKIYKISLSRKESELKSKEKEIGDIENQGKLEEVTCLREQILILKGKILAKELSVRNMNRKMKGFVSSYLKVSNPFMTKMFDKKVVVSKFSEKDWQNFDEQLNFVYPDFIRNLKKECPNMSDNEFRFCCLYLLGVKTSVIANVLDLQPNTISKYVKDIAMKYFNSSQYDSLSENLNELASKSIFLETSFWGGL
ncbi:hypothetical protein DWW91_21190 [Parabacteroides sp. AF17-3]|uniref:tetratricopeptide repeat protein n=1 Tax=Parabacteroides sp. AF17-3 TaxID=2293113 RepID=UPI000EFF0FBA|nr:tetratricopeptide repeat protein [Parabacteroides sp. AF17-3]RKU65092.1 hypothetical protein DWW91_21190 [Parabacteroides sp. AF17-3]